MRRLLAILVGLLGLGGVAAVGAWHWWRGPDPAEILARIGTTPAPVLPPAAERATFRIAPGFRVELVAAEPLVVDPVAMDWDDHGRLYVVEMRGYMPSLDAEGADAPVGRVVILDDRDGDGRMDERRVFLDGLVLPRAVAVLPQGVLVGVPPDLILCRDTTGDDACDERTRLAPYGVGQANVEHMENRLLPALDGWIYNAKSSRRFRFGPDGFEVGDTRFRGQWGMDQDDGGLLFWNHNSGLLYGEEVPAAYTMRQAGTARAPSPAGLSVDLAAGELVWGVRTGEGLNRAYLRGTLRADGRQAGPTGASGLAIQRGDQFGPEYAGHAFVPEVAGNAVAHLAVRREGLDLRAEHRLYPDPDWGQREFLASTHERFRPVDARIGPDGALWVIDMYRGLVQHRQYVSAHLAAHVRRQGFEDPGATGRIWRVVRADRPLRRGAPPLDGFEQRLAALDHPNGWLRDRAQRALVHEASTRQLAAVAELDRFGARGRAHAIRVLAQRGALSGVAWRRALADPDPAVRVAALRAAAPTLADADTRRARDAIALLDDPDERVALEALHAVGSLPPALRPLDRLLAAGRSGDERRRHAALSGLAGLEEAALDAALSGLGDSQPDTARRRWLGWLAGVAHVAALARGDDDAIVRGLDRVATTREGTVRTALARGIAAAHRWPGVHPVELAAPHPLLAGAPAPGDPAAAELRGLRRFVTWPGDPTPGGARPLRADERVLRERGRALFAATCAACHGADGAGQPGLAPPLAGSHWVRDSDDWLVRIVDHGVTGPIVVNGRVWELAMPGHRDDERFDDEALAGLLTHLRRSWGHADAPVSPERVAAVRAATTDRATPWTADELLALPVEHRLDRYAGRYRVPVVGVEVEVGREGFDLTLGQPDGPRGPAEEVGDGVFVVGGNALRFDVADDGTVESATLTIGGADVPLRRVVE